MRSARSSRRCPTFGVDYGNAVDEAVAESFPASDPPSHSEPGAAIPAGRAGGRLGTRRSRPRAHRGDRVRARWPDRPARPRLRRDRRDHLVHKHLEPVRDGRCRTAREEGRRARPRPAALGQVEPRAGLEGRERVLRARRPDPVPRGPRLPHGRLRVYDVHRELRALAGAGLEGDRRRQPRRVRGPVRQPELRGARAPGGEGELPRKPAARRRVRACGPHGRRRRDGAART